MDIISIYRASAKPVVKLLTVVVLTETIIMLSLRWFFDDQTGPWADIADVTILGIVTSIVTWLWIMRPMQQAREQDAFFRTIAQSASAGMVITDAHNENCILYTNPAFTQITGYALADVKGKNPGLLNAGMGQKHEQALVNAAISAHKPVHTILKNQRKDGTSFWNDLQLSPIMGSDGNPRYWLGLLNDVSELRNLNKRVEQLAAAVEQSHDAICLADENGLITFANSAYLRCFGAATADMNGMHITHDFANKTIASLTRDMLSHSGHWSGQHLRMHADGSEYDAQTVISSMQDMRGKQVFIASHRDITEQVQQQEEMAHARKMEAVGTLAGGIAHDFNNMLAGMLGQLYLLRRHVAANEHALERIGKIEEQGYHGANLISQMLTFARKQSMDLKAFDLCQMTRELESMLRVSVPETIALSFDIDASELPVLGDIAQLESCVMNLINNARHAIEDADHQAGHITVSIHREKIRQLKDEQQAGLHITSETHPHDCVHIRIADNGCGMDEETLSHIFEPFFFTKAAGRGTGLGLPMIAGCIDMSGGVIDVHSTSGAGSSFDIWLPLHLQPQKQDGDASVSLIDGHGETVLLVDDNNDVCMALKELLESMRYKVLLAHDGEEGLALFKANQERIDLVLSDLVMPRRNGQSMIHEIRRISQRHIPVALMTGYDPADHDCMPDDDILLIRKPWTASSLNQVLNLIDIPSELAVECVS